MRIAPSLRLSVWLQRRSLALVLGVALVLVQSLGLLHRVAHFDRVSGGAAARVHALDAAQAPGDRAQRTAVQRTGPGWLLALFAGHVQALDCDGFDQMSHADLAVGTALDASLPTAPLEACNPHAAWHVAAQARGFLARAPPAVA